MTTNVEDIRNQFESSPFFAYIGFEVIQFEEGNVRLKLNIEKHMLNINGTLHGGIHATMLDTILGIVIRSLTKARVVTTSLTVHYLGSLSSGEIYAEAKILQEGYKTAFAEGEIKDSAGNLIAKGTGVFKLIRDE
ncbi:PaaI family thioesterase [Peribacillus sp. NPDC097264]|uniref:PaaI family thioesterase n=1 Tax=Peribacillus sp. NPDC097264 TaxID=3390616 RepID=UPI003D074B03